MLEPIGFWSYTRLDDEHAGGSLSRLRKLLLGELQQRVGRRPVRLFQDIEAIPYGSDWQQQIDAWIAASAFFIPIVTPSFLQSEGCSYEVTEFRKRAAAQGWDDVIFPLYYTDADEFADERRDDCFDPAVRDFLWRRQIFNFRDLRLRSTEHEDVRHRIATLSDAIYRALLRNGRAATLPRSTGSGAAGTASTAAPQAAATAQAQPLAAPPIVAPPARAAEPSAPAIPLPGSILREPPGPEMVLVPAGRFIMGIPPEETRREGADEALDGDARPQHTVTIARPFYLGKFPMTRGEFAAFARATGFAADDWRKPGFEQTDQHPVVKVSHQDAEAYAAWLSRETGKDYRLPTEAEWEYAARAGTTTARYWSDGRAEACRFASVADETLRKANKDEADPQRYFGCDDGFAYTSPVGSFRPNEFGLYDMLGNVWEWVADHWHDSYDSAPTDGSAWTDRDNNVPRVLRGGSWNDYPRYLRAGVRSWVRPDNRYYGAGFRLARTL